MKQNLADNNPVSPRSRGDHFDTHVPRDAVNRETLGGPFGPDLAAMKLAAMEIAAMNKS